MLAVARVINYNTKQTADIQIGWDYRYSGFLLVIYIQVGFATYSNSMLLIIRFLFSEITENLYIDDFILITPRTRW